MILLKKAIVTGANGFIGKHLVKELVDKNVKIFAVDKDTLQKSDDLSVSGKLAYIKCELSEIARLYNLISDRDIDVVYHLAWDGVKPDLRNDFSRQVANIEYSLELIKIAKKIGVKRVILLGSTMEYMYNSKPIDEYALPTPQNAYGSAKLATRYLCAQLAKDLGLDYIYGVTTSVYGIGREDNNVIYYTIQKLLSGAKPSLTRLEQKWDFIHINDLVLALHLLGDCNNPRSFYPIGKGDNLPLSKFVYIVRNLIDKKLPLGIGEVPYADDKLPSSCIDTRYLEEDIGFKANISFEEGIKELIHYYEKKKVDC